MVLAARTERGFEMILPVNNAMKTITIPIKEYDTVKMVYRVILFIIYIISKIPTMIHVYELLYQ